MNVGLNSDRDKTVANELLFLGERGLYEFSNRNRRNGVELPTVRSLHI